MKHLFFKKPAFTLAEALIAMAIIGVIAAMVVPSLMTKIQKKTLSTQLKATYSLLSNSITSLACARDNADWVKDINNTPKEQYGQAKAIQDYENCIVGNLKRAKVYGYIYPVKSRYKEFDFTYKTINGATGIAPQTDSGTTFYTMILANGSYLFLKFANNSNGTVSRPYVYVDVNGNKGPNVLGKDLFYFVLSDNIRLYIPGSGKTREYLLENCTTETISEFATMCSALAQKDGWEFKDDYPW